MTTCGLWFRDGTVRAGAPDRTNRRSPAAFRAIPPTPVANTGSMSGGPPAHDRRGLPGPQRRTHAHRPQRRRSALWKTGFGGLDPAHRRRPARRLAGAAGRPAGPRQVDLRAAGRPQHGAPRGRPVLYFSYEHDAEDLTQKLIAMEAGELDDSDQVRMTASARSSTTSWVSSLEHRLEAVPARPAGAGQGRARTPRCCSCTARPARAPTSRPSRPPSRWSASVSGTTPLVIVDYLQKVQVGHGRDEDRAVHGDRRGPQGPRHRHSAPRSWRSPRPRRTALTPGQRMRANHLRGFRAPWPTRPTSCWCSTTSSTSSPATT